MHSDQGGIILLEDEEDLKEVTNVPPVLALSGWQHWKWSPDIFEVTHVCKLSPVPLDTSPSLEVDTLVDNVHQGQGQRAKL